MFIKGHLSFQLAGHSLEFVHRDISLFGVTGLPWAPLSRDAHFGKTIDVVVKVASNENPWTFRTRGILGSEQSAYGDYLSIKFLMDADTRAQLQKRVAMNGHVPTDHMRKYPRIPADPTIQTYPLHALVIASSDSKNSAPSGQPIAFEVSNISPNGIMLSTENSMSTSIVPGSRVQLKLDPRGWFPMPIYVEGLVCRVLSEINPGSGNPIRRLGIKFTRVNNENRAAFLELLKVILQDVSAKMGSKSSAGPTNRGSGSKPA